MLIHALEFFHNSSLIRQGQQKEIYKKLESWAAIEPRLIA